MLDRSNFRYERKYAWPFQEPSVLEQKISVHPALFTRVFPTRKIFSLYFDTPNLHFLQQNALGQSPRAKIRLRWYKLNEKTTEPNLEIKYKDGEVNTKHISEYADLFDLNSIEQVTQVVRKMLSGKIDQAALLQPSLYNHYHRQYFFSAQTQIRLTIDSDLHFQQFVDYTSGMPAQRFEFCVVEAKYQIKDDVKLRQVIDALPLRISKVSKYEFGMKATYPQA